MAEKDNTTIDDLARMVKRGFEKTAQKIEVDKRFDKIDKRFDKVDKRFDRVEGLILANHKRRIEKLEKEVKELRDLLAV